MMHTHLWQMDMDMHTRTHTEAQSEQILDFLSFWLTGS